MDETGQTSIQNPVIQTPKTNWLLLLLAGTIILIVGIVVGIFISKYLPVFSPLTLEAVCQKGGYQDVRSCGGYFIAGKPCCDQGADIWNTRNQIVVSCGGYMPPPGAPESKCEKLLKTLDTKNCQEFTCSPEDAKKIKSSYSFWEQTILFIRRFLSGNDASRAISTAVKVTPTPSPAAITDPTANWKTYVDDRFYFSVKYPENWVTLSFSDKWEPGTPIFVYSPDSKTSSIEGKVIGVIEGQGIFFSVNTYNKPQVTVKSLDNLAIGKNSKKTELTINQISGLLIVNEERTNSIEKLFVFEKEDYTFVVQLFWRKDKPEDEKTLDQILSTFKFMEQDNAFCGGIAGTPCPSGYTCQLEGNYPDASGKCIPLR